MPRICLWTTLGALLALGGIVQAADGPCKAPRSYDYGSGTPSCDRCGDVERKIEQRLLEPISLDLKDMPLGQVIDTLREISGINVVPDYDDLKTSGVNLQQPLTLKVEEMSLRSTLELLLEQAQLSYVIKDEALQITTAPRRQPHKLVTYPVADLVVPIGSGDSELPPFLCRCKKIREILGEKACSQRLEGMTGEDLLMKLIVLKVAPDSWAEVGGKGTLQYFPLGISLVVKQTPEVQEQVAEFLAELRRLRESEDKEYTLETRVKYLKPGDYEITQFPRVTFVRGQQVHLEAGDAVTLRDGSIRDFQTSWFQPAGTQPEQVKTGLSLRAKVTTGQGGKLRLDVTLRRAELVEATRGGVQLSEQSDRVIRQVAPGETVKVVLSRNEQGKVRSWLALTLREVQAAAHCKPLDALQGAAATCRDKAVMPVSTQPMLPPIPR